MRYTCTQGFWYWVSGFSICYQNWAPGNGTGGEDCSSVEKTRAVKSRGGQQWVSLPETHKRNFICTTYEVDRETQSYKVKRSKPKSKKSGKRRNPEMDKKWVSVLFLLSAVCGVSAYVPHRYHFVNESKTWTEAQSYCRQNYTDLATISNMEEMKKLNATLNEKARSSVWIGLDRGFWKSGEPHDQGGNKKCAAVSKTDQGQWHDVDCETTNPFICHENQLILIKQNLTWREALRYCRVKHVDLVSVHSEEIQLWVKEVAQNASTEHVWLGLRHTCTLSFWFWMSGVSICYQNWAPGNGTGGEDCSSVERTGAVQSRGGQQWVSLPEDQELNFICLSYED
ncbi:hypothetical protein SRHO_G00188190 [Serrasalmus rhombeus]